VSLSGAYVGKAGGALAKERLSQYTRYAALVEEQEQALGDEDLERFERLAEEIALLQLQIGQPDAGEDEHVDDAVTLIREALARGERIHERLSEMRRDSAAEIRSMTRRRPQARRYVTGAGGGREEAARLDVRL
jgi:hypothetical protein